MKIIQVLYYERNQGGFIYNYYYYNYKIHIFKLIDYYDGTIYNGIFNIDNIKSWGDNLFSFNILI